MRKFFGLIVMFALIAFGGAASALASAPMLTPLDGGSTPICIAATAAQAPMIGNAFVGRGDVYTLYVDGKPTHVRVALDGRQPRNFLGYIVETPISAPACGSTDDANNGVKFVNGLCFAESSRNAPPHTQCMLGD